ncbi:MAG: hypothetical protein WCL12_06735 [Actinomycetes bacterium]
MALASTSARRPRYLRITAFIAAILALSLLSTACSKKSNGVSGSGTSGSGSAAGLDDASPGVTATTIKIGFLYTSLGKVSASLGFKQANYGDVPAQINALVNYVNANGGIGGRQIIADLKPYEGSLDAPDYAESFCNAFTQDDQVFAVVFEGQLQNNVRPCYSARKTIMIDQGLLAKDAQEFAKFTPYLWSPTFPEYGSYLKAELQSLQTQGWLTGAKGVSLIGIDNDVARRQIEQTVIPFLATAGITNTKTFFIDTANIGTLGAGSSTALTGTKSAGLDRIIVIGGARILPIAVSSSESNDLLPGTKWSVSTYDSPLFLEDNPDSEVISTLDGMTGFGVIPAADIRDDPSLPFPNPANPAEVKCDQIIDNAGAEPKPPIRPNYKTGFAYCDGLFFLKGVIDKAPKDLTAANFRDAAFSLGTSYQSSLSFGGSFGQGNYAYTTIGRAMVYDQTCVNPVTITASTKGKGCFRYQGGDVNFTLNQTGG